MVKYSGRMVTPKVGEWQFVFRVKPATKVIILYVIPMAGILQLMHPLTTLI